MSLRALWWLRLPSLGSGRRLVWALALALLLPLAQGVAARHAITHHSAPTQRDAAPSALDATCVQCLLAAPIGAGALPSTPAATLAPTATHAVPVARVSADPTGAPALAYRSRAPPVFLH